MGNTLGALQSTVESEHDAAAGPLNVAPGSVVAVRTMPDAKGMGSTAVCCFWALKLTRFLLLGLCGACPAQKCARPNSENVHCSTSS